MSQRVKRPNRSEDGSVPVKRRKRTAAEEEEAASLAAGAWQPRSNEMKGIYNRTTTEAPAELFRKDLISAMKLPDSEPLAADEYWVIVDQWKQEWERGVQVPVNPDSLPEPLVTVNPCKGVKHHKDFKLPKNKYIRITKDENFKVDDHILSSAPAQSEAACSYDLDECDVAWLRILNSERAASGLGPVYEDQLERAMERMEICCWDKIQSILRNEEGLGIEYDENVICDVCRSPDSEDGNEMVFCDSCNICVHQACYGITRIPKGEWLCCTCSIGKRPECVLCPNKGGAMKCTRSGQKWAHVSCALWIPEVSIGCVEKMEPITKISSIPSSRWALICVLCRERVGACIQCSVKTCKTAYHVTCAFKHGLEMRAIIEDENADDGVKLRSYCEKHSKSSKKDKSICSGSEDDDIKRKKRKDMTSEEKNQARAVRLQEIEAEFYKHVTVKDVSVHLDVDNEALQYIYNYWKLKRRAGSNKPLLPPKSEDVDMLSHKREQADIEKMKMFVQLRQDLERVRNLCYMVSRREKLSRTFFRMREQTFHKQAQVLDSHSLPPTVVQAVIEANHGPSIYDRLYSHNKAKDHTSDFETILARIAGVKSPTQSGDERKPEINGLFKDVKNNPYKKLYFNGSSRRSSSRYCSSLSSASSGDERLPKDNKENRIIHSSSDETENLTKPKSQTPRKRTLPKQKKSVALCKDDSSSDDVKPTKKDWVSRSRLGQVASDINDSGSESDELMPIGNSHKTDANKLKHMSIYSDSESSDASMKNDDKSSNATNDSQNKLRTKAAVKEFSHKPSTSKKQSSPENKKKAKEESPIKKQDYVPSDLIVPQRQAAKKATENLKYNTRTKEHNTVSHSEDHNNKIEEKAKPKNKTTKVAANKETVKEPPKEPEVKEKKKENKTTQESITEKENDLQEILAYVPQRQAAKKAAEHIKSGLGKPTPAATHVDQTNTEQTKKDKQDPVKSKSESKKEPDTSSPAKIPETKRKSSTQSTSTSSSSSSSSSDSSTSSSSDSDDEPEKPQPRSESLFSTSPREPTKRPTNAKDWPFLDKGPKPAATSSNSSDSNDSSAPSSPGKPVLSPPPPSQSKTDSSSRVAKPTRKSTDKKPAAAPTTTTPPKREEQARSRGRGRGRISKPSNSGDRIGNVNVRLRDMPDDECVGLEGERTRGRKGKPSAGDELGNADKKETTHSDKLLSEIDKTEQKLTEDNASEEINLEKEITERKLGKEGLVKTKSTIDRLFGSPEKKNENDSTGNNDKVSRKKLEKSPRINEKPNKIVNKSTTPEEIVSSNDKSIKTSPEKLKTPSKETPISEKQSTKIDKKDTTVERKPTNKKSPSKNKTIDDIFASKLASSDTKENKAESVKFPSKHMKLSEEISVADKIVDDHLQSHKENDLYHKNVSKTRNDITLDKSNVTEHENEKRNSLKPTEVLQNRSIFSPQPHSKDADLLDFVHFDDNFGMSKDDEIIKGPLTFTFNNSVLIKEDTKEDSTRETLNLVEKLRMELSKKSTGYKSDGTTSNDVESEKDPSELNGPVEKYLLVENKEKIGNEPVSLIDTQKSTTQSLPQENSHHKLPHQEQLQQYQEQPQQPNYPYLNCEANLPLDRVRNIPLQQTQNLDQVQRPPVQEERWAMPNDPTYPVVQPPDTTMLNNSHYVQQFHKPQPNINAITQMEAQKNQSPIVNDGRIPQTPLIDPASLDCMPSPSPYGEIHPQAKWADFEVMPSRRSSVSSAASSSSSSRRDDEDACLQDVRLVNHSSLDMATYLPQQVAPFPSNPMENFGAFPDPAFVPVSLFPPQNINTQLPFPPTGSTGMYPPALGAPFPAPHIPPLSKPLEETAPFSSTCTAAFTSSQHNMALTAAMVNVSTPKPMEEIVPPVMEAPVTLPVGGQPPTEEAVPSPALSNATPTNNTLPSPSTSLKSNNSSLGKKSPSKPTRTSARVTSQMLNKSPAKSPGKSPRQEVSQKQSGPGRGKGEGKRGAGKSGPSRTQTGNRGRGRGRGRNRGSHHNDFDYTGSNTIHTKLVGTVYDLDFDDDISNDNMTDLKSMRERRKSVDIHERKLDSFSSPQSPKFSSPSQTSHKNRYSTDLRELRPPTPIADKSKTDSISSDNDSSRMFPVTPVLPGPVDMRTYNSNYDQNTYNEQNLLTAFATGTTETSVHEDIDEDFEKELHSALSAKKVEEAAPPEIASNIKVSLSDSRNQLKVKIKGPIANYTSTVAPLPPPIVVSNINANSATNNAINSASMGGMSSGGTSSLRRMRKKELLRQYWTQDMNMDDPTSSSTNIPTMPPVNRTVITIPKAVASMTSIPTKEDYRDYRTGAEDIIETKHHKKARSGGLSRELRQLDLSLDDDFGSERRRSLGSVGSNTSNSFDTSLTHKKRGRPARPTAPKLKIKIGNNSSIVESDDKKDRIRPPKKRLTTIKMPSVEDLKRDSMKFRKKVMADLKREKHKKKKAKQEVQIISNQCENPTKLIIRFGKKPIGESDNRTSEVNNRIAGNEKEEKPDGESEKTPPKLTPIKLKLSRCQEGSGYIMKPASCHSNTETKAEEVQATQPGQPPPTPVPPDPSSETVQIMPPSLPASKDCEVR